jgi:hypothetical protein
MLRKIAQSDSYNDSRIYACFNQVVLEISRNTRISQPPKNTWECYVRTINYLREVGAKITPLMDFKPLDHLLSHLGV